MIYVNGDSFSEQKSPVDTSWPARLAELTGHNVVNESVGCGSNSRALSNLISYYHAGNSPDLVIFGLTTPQRTHLPSSRSSSWSFGPNIINDRTGESDLSGFKWFNNKCYDVVEYTYQYYSIIWQTHELCKNIIGCPSLFINMWDTEIEHFDSWMRDSNAEQIKRWINKHVSDTLCYTTLDYYKKFDFLASKRNDWNMPSVCLNSMLSNEYYPINDMHPNAAGNLIIAKEIAKLVDNIL